MADDTSTPLWFRLFLGIGALSAGLGIIIAAVTIGITAAPSWLLSVGQIVLTVLVVVIAAILIVLGASWTVSRTLDDIKNLERRFPEQIERAKQRTPTFVAVLLFVSEAIVIIADKSFEGNTVATLTVSFVMLLGFTLANELMAKAGRLLRITGLALWFLILAFLPCVVMINRSWGVRQLGSYLWSLPMATKLFFGLAALVMVVVPILMKRIDDAETAAPQARMA